MRLPVQVAKLLTVAFALLATLDANATPNFPGAIQRILGASKPPQCAICHLCGITGRGTVNTPWGTAMRARGLHEFNEASLAAALAAMERDQIDSDADGTIDVDAVTMGKDPNPADTCSVEDDTIPRYGCVGRISPGGPHSGGIAMVFGALAILLVRSRGRRQPRGGRWSLALLLACGAGAGCASGARLSPRSTIDPPIVSPRMVPVEKSSMADELRAIKLDPMRLPVFGELLPDQRRRVMSLFTRSLGFTCTNCHATADYLLPTRAKAVTIQMWNEFTRPYSLAKEALFCDSCHHGEGNFLDRRNKNTVSQYMTANFTDKLQRQDKKEVECETCHGDPFEPNILVKPGRF